MTTLQPTRKVTVGALGGALTVIVVWILGLWSVTVPPEVASAITVLVSFGLSYFVNDPPRRG